MDSKCRGCGIGTYDAAAAVTVSLTSWHSQWRDHTSAFALPFKLFSLGIGVSSDISVILAE